MQKGKFITLYGINNVGKTTQAKLLVKRLKKEGYKAVYIKYPIYEVEPSGQYINKILRSHKQKISEAELQLWFVVNRYQFQPELKKLLEKGYMVVAEDYVGTGIAWGASKGLSMEFSESINKGLLSEDFAILLEGKRNIIAKEKKHVHEQNDALIEKCGNIHSVLAKKYGWKRIAVEQTIDGTAEVLWKTVGKFLPSTMKK